MKILITGGAGYLGSVLTPTLLAQGHEVTVLDNFYFNQNSLLDCCQHERFSVLRGDCREESVIKPLVAKADLIIPLAALVGVPICNTDQVATRTTNQEAVEMLCRLAGKQQWIIMPVTNSGYGIGEKGKFCTEDTPLRPISTLCTGTTRPGSPPLSPASAACSTAFPGRPPTASGTTTRIFAWALCWRTLRDYSTPALKATPGAPSISMSMIK